MKNIIFLIFILILSIIEPSYSKNIALLVGINDYIYLDKESDLKGCINDISYMKQILISKYGFNEENIKTIVNKDATSENIIKEFKNLIINKAGPDDIVVFHFSGHGTYLNDDNGDEADGFDEALCGADCAPDSDKGYIRDDIINELLKQVKTDKITLIFDCCHSGTGTKGLYNCSPGQRFYMPRFMVGRGKAVENSSKTEGNIHYDNTSKGTLISGCAADETSSDAYMPYGNDGIWMGALTNSLYKTLLFTSPGATYEEVINDVIRNISEGGYEQNPQLEGNFKNKPVFYVPSKSVELSIPIKKKNNQILLQRGGLCDGVTVGSTYEIYPPGEKSYNGKGSGKIKIIKTSEMESVGKIIDGNVEDGSKAFEVARTYTDEKESINVMILDRDLKTSIGPELTKLGYVKIIEAGMADRIIDKIPDIGVFDIVLYYPDGREVSKVQGKNEKDLVIQLSRWLESAYTIKKLSKLENPHSNFKIKVWTDKEGSSPSYHIGECVTFNFKSEKDCYVTLIDVGTDGTITILFPNKVNSSNKIKANTVYTIPSKEMGFTIKVAPPPGQEMVKAIATQEPLDLSSMTGVDISATFKSIDSPSTLDKIPEILSKGLTVEGITGDNSTTLSGWTTSSVLLNIDF